MYRVLIVGGGSIGERHLRCFSGTGRVEASVCDTRPAVLTELQQHYPVSETFEDLGAMDPSAFDAAVVCVPTQLHVPYARRLVDAGAHVLIEKPLSVTLDGIDELARAAQATGRTVGVAFPRRAMRVYRAVHEAVAAGTIGDVLSAVCLSGYDHAVARPDYRGTYCARRETGGGTVADILSHFINLVQWFFGPVREVTCRCDHLHLADVEVEDTATLVLRFSDTPATVTLHAVQWQAHAEELVTLSGTSGSIRCDRVAGRFGTFLTAGGEWDWRKGLTGKRDSKGQTDEPFVAEANNFLDAIEGKADVLTTLAEARHTVEICIAALASNERQCAVQL